MATATLGLLATNVDFFIETSILSMRSKYSIVQFKFSQAFCHGQVKASRMYPDTYDKICEQISPKEGELWLIGAGFLGKIFCDIVKQRGGIAIDIGAVTDAWSGYFTRDYLTRSVKWDR